MSVFQLFVKAAAANAKVAAANYEALLTRPAGRSKADVVATMSRFPSQPAKASYKERLARLNAAAKARRNAEKRAAAKLLRTRKEVLSILRFGGKVIFSLNQEVLSSALNQAKEAGRVAFTRVVQEYALACMENGVEFDTNCTTWVAKEAYKMAIAAEKQAVRNTLRELLRGHLEAAGVKVRVEHTTVVAEAGIKTREAAAQSVKATGRYAHLEVAKAKAEAEGTVVYTEQPKAAKVAKVKGVEREVFNSYTAELKKANKRLEMLPKDNKNEKDRATRQILEAYIVYLGELIITYKEYKRGNLSLSDKRNHNREAHKVLANVVKKAKSKVTAEAVAKRKAKKAEKNKKGNNKKNK